MGFAITSTANQRPRVLLSYLSAVVTIVHKTYGRVEGLNGPIGSLAWMVASMARPIVHPLEHQWMLILAFVDDQILNMENIIMSIFPALTPIFAKVDELAFLAKSLPKMFDDTVDGLLLPLHQLPLSDGTLIKKSVNMKADLDSSEETEIVVDIKCCEQQNWDEGSLHEEREMEGRMHDEGKEYWRAKMMEKDIKEVERSCEEIMETLERMGMVDEGKGHEKKDDVGTDEGKLVVSQSQEKREGEPSDPILELFDEGWQSKPLKAKKGR